MITTDEHKEMVRRFLSAVSFADGHCKELILSVKDLTRIEKLRLDELARKKGMSVEDYTKQTIMDAARKQLGPDLDIPEEESKGLLTDEQARAYKYAMRSARIFEVPAEGMKTLFGEIQEASERDLYALVKNQQGDEVEKEVRQFHKHVLKVAEQYKVFPDVPMDGPIPPEFNRARAALSDAYNAIKRLPLDLPEFPDKRPFDSCLFMAPDMKAFSKEMFDIPFRIEGDRRFLGLLISPRICCFIVFVENDSFIDMQPVLIRWQDEWVGAGHMVGPRTTDTFVRLINDFKRIIEERSVIHNRSLLDKLRKQRGMVVMAVPPPFYVVHLSSQLIKEHKRLMLPSRPRQWQHRWPVRGHTMMRFRRGKLPMDPKLKKILSDRKYKIWTVDSPDPETMLELGRRNIAPPKIGEWLATLVRWRKDFVKGPEDKPFIPSAHRVPDEQEATGRN